MADDLARKPRHGRITLLALSFAGGIGVGVATTVPVGVWLAGTLVCALAAFGVRRRERVALPALAITTITLGAAWIDLRDAVAADDLLAHLRAAPIPVRVLGTALGRPVRRTPGAGSLGRFDFREPFTEFRIQVDALVSRENGVVPVRGALLVRVEETVAPFRAGDRLDVRGVARRGGAPQNPGAFDYDRFLRARGIDGILSVSGRGLVQVTPVATPARSSRVARLRAGLRARAETALFADLPGAAAAPDAARNAAGSSTRDAVLAALLLGRRDRDPADISGAFRRVGLAHLLAISGLHLGILVGLALLLVGVAGASRGRHAAIVALVILTYLLLIDVRLPVLRAAVMTMAGTLARAGRRRWRAGSLVALSGLALLVWRPEQLFDPGFQLSFGVVLALVHFAPDVRARWFGLRDEAAGPIRMLLEWTKSAVAVAVLAWAVATPITMCHFGTISPGAVPLSVIALPIVTALLALGYAKILLAAVLPSAALLVGHGLAHLTDALVAAVIAVDAWPGSVVHVPRPGAAWAILAEGWVIAWARGFRRQTEPRSLRHRTLRWADDPLRGPHDRPSTYRNTPSVRSSDPRRGLSRPTNRSVTQTPRRRCWVVAGAGLVGWAAWPALPLGPGPDLRIDMLAVGDGTCHVVRSGGHTAVLDAGSGTNLDAGRRVILPALRALGVRRIDWIAISHANLDHYAAVIEIVEAYPSAEVLLTPQFIATTEADPDGAGAFLLGALARSGTTVTTVTAGHARSLRRASVRWLHPCVDTAAARENDNSMVIAFETSRHRALFTGDIETEGIATLRRRFPDLTADTLELPHHGSFGPAAVALVDALDPAVVLQSTGPRRLERDPWAEPLSGRRRLVTARDGACRVDIDDTDGITAHRLCR